jgi:putative PEP-CTERM system TPR-repeat lipoprotein
MKPFVRRQIQRLLPISLVFLLFGFWIASPAQANISEKSIKLHEEARDYLVKGNYKSAVIQLKNAIRADPDNVQARFDLATIYLRGRDGASAEKELKAARKRGMPEDSILLFLAQAYSLQGKNHKILDEISSENRPDNLAAGALAARAGAYVALKRLEDAKQSLITAIKLAPENPVVYEALSQVFQADGDMKGAEENIDKALSFSPEKPRLLVRKAGIRQALGDIDEAIIYYTKALNTGEANTAARIGRASALIAINKDDDAKLDVDAVLKKSSKNPIAIYLQALLLARQKNFEKAAERLQSVSGLLTDYAPAAYLNASLSFAQGRIEQAQSHIQRYLAKQPSSQRGRRLLAAIYLRKKNPGESIKILEPLVKASPGDSRLLTLLGNAYVASGQHTKAAEIYQTVIAESPKNTSARTRLALTHLNTGDSESAVKEFETILGQDPDATRANLLLVLTHLRNRNFGPASKAVTELKKRMPDSPMPHNFEGTINLAQGRTAKAKSNFSEALRVQPDFFPAALNLGEIERAAGNLDGARVLYHGILKVKSKHLQAMLRLAKIEQAQGNLEAAGEWLASAVKANPRAPMARLQFVNFLLQTKKYKKALAEARDFSQIEAKNPDALDALARAQFATGQKQSAVATYQQLATIAPRSALVFHRLGRSLAATENYRDAAEALDRAIRLDANLDSAKRDRVRVENQKSGMEAAITLTKEIIKSSPKSAIGYNLLGDLYFSGKKFPQASKQYAYALERHENSTTVAKYYQSQVRAGKPVEGRNSLEKWVKSHPNDHEIQFLFASALIGLKDFKGAIRENEALLEEFPENAALLNDLGWLYGEIKDTRAVPYASRAYKLQPNSAAIADTLGWLLLRAGKVKESLPILEKARNGAPNHPEIGYHYAVSLNKNGQNGKARKTIKAVLDTGKKFQDINQARALYKNLLNK